MAAGSSRVKRICGFTLIELLVTIAVIAIMATVAFPGFQRMMAVNRMAADYNEVLSGLNFARNEAIKRRAEVTFDVTTSSPWGYQVTVAGVTDPIRVRSGRDNTTEFSDESFAVTFDALGKRTVCVLTGSDCALSLTHSSAANRLIEVNSIGRVKGVISS